jgi:hypothetical protein
LRSRRKTEKKAFEPGKVWKDSEGQPVNAHGGGVLFRGGVYYSYGELKEGRSYLPKVNQTWGGTRVLAGGVSCYSSTTSMTGKMKASLCRLIPRIRIMIWPART